MKSINIAAMIGAAALVVAGAASAASITVEGVGGIGPNRTVNNESLNAPAWESFGPVNLGTEVEAIKYSDVPSTNVNVSLKAGMAFNKLLVVSLPTGLSVYGVGELGENFNGGSGTNFYGLEAGARYRVMKPVTLNVSYRYRDGFNSTVFSRQQRLGAGLSLDIAKNYTVGANYYREFDRNHGDEVGVSITRRF